MAKIEFTDKEIAGLLSQKDGADPGKLSKDLKTIGYTLQYPEKLPYLLKDVSKIKPNKDLKIGLAAVLVDCEIKMNSDLHRYSMRKFAAETLEKALWGESFLEDSVMLIDDEPKKKSERNKGSKKKK